MSIMRSRTTHVLLLFAALTLGALSHAQTVSKTAASGPARRKLIGAWHLVSMEEPGPDGKLRHITGRTGQLIYTRDGHMSVQLIYPPSESAVSNDYVLNGYEASFGSYDVDESAHIVTHHVQASITRGLIGKNLPRAFQFSNGNLIIKSIRPDEHWSVTWQHD
jgi:hypothetical protein